MAHSRTSYVCLPCRASHKHQHGGDQWRSRRSSSRRMIRAGSAFAPPRRRDAAGRTPAVLLNAGVRFRTGCCGGPGHRPRPLCVVRERTAFARRTGTPFAAALVPRDLP
ncbi:deoxyxylulose-5-phosphate synthase [Streptomyces pristinaespiralis]|uniref:deoxyxylulose-5-phosphate synthase n=1 Tax=Streptomyces pristinaespiralis TaxID=38300 RepID=UPI00379F6A34